MELRITYVHHDCFLVDIGPRVLLFDYPERAHRPATAEALVTEALRGRNAVIFASHSHDDHFSMEILKFRETAASAHYILSYDVAEMHPELDPEFEAEMQGVSIVEPDEFYHVEGFVLRCFESTDLGVGFLLELEGKRIYFGGDVAEWCWPDQDERSRRFSEEHFAGVLNDLAKEAVDLAFSNADPRLENWAGARRFMETVRPRYFVPMHTFGDTSAVARFAAEHRLPGIPMFVYSQMGESWRIAL